MPQGDMTTRVHRYVLCDGCQRHEFPGRRYHCLRCHNYDLCGECYDQCVQTENHLMDHPMQLILLEQQSVSHLLSGPNGAGGPYEQLHMCNCYTCPYCKAYGHTAKGLIQHVYGLHSEDDSYVVCPMCAGMQGDNLRAMQNLSRHLLTNHIDYANYLEPNTPPLPALPPDVAASSRRRLRSHSRVLQLQQQQQNNSYAQMVNTGQFTTDDPFRNMSNVHLNHDLLNNLRTFYSDEDIAHMTRLTASHFSASGRTSSTTNTPFILGNIHAEKLKKELRPKTDRSLLSKWIDDQQKQWVIDAKANKIREKQAVFTEQILLSMLCEEYLELPEKDTMEDTLDLKLSETESIETIDPNLSKTDEPPENLEPLGTGKDLPPKISKVMSLMSMPWTKAFSASRTDDGNSSARNLFIQLVDSTTEETQVD